MFQVMTDSAGNLYYYPVDNEPRNARPSRRPKHPPAHERRPQHPPYQHMQPYQPMQPMQPYPPMQPFPMPQAPGMVGVDMATAMKALGAILPGMGQTISAFRRAPDKPDLTGEPTKDLPNILEYISEVFEHNRTGDQLTGVLATTGAMLEILGTL